MLNIAGSRNPAAECLTQDILNPSLQICFNTLGTYLIFLLSPFPQSQNIDQFVRALPNAGISLPSLPPAPRFTYLHTVKDARSHGS
jgi:hypothetical protein